MAPVHIILASASPRRQELLGLTGLPFSVRPADVDESLLPGEPPAGYVRRLALEKARAARNGARPGQVVLAADTTVALGNEILGKPADAEEAVDMLRRLRGRTHQVYTAVAFYDPAADRVVSALCATDVTMRDYAESEIEAYVASGDPLDKGGAYAIQNASFHPVQSLQGCYTSVMGLPLCLVVQGLNALFPDLALPEPELCQNQPDHDGSPSLAVLTGSQTPVWLSPGDPS